MKGVEAKKILVTGATGFVGRHVVAELLSSGCEVRAVARDIQVARTMPWFDRVEFIAADIHAPDLDVSELTEQVAVLMHLAWPGLPNYKALFHFERTLFADYAFLKKVIQAGVGQVMVTGTCFEYGQQSGALAENLLPQPNTPYALAKNSLRLFLQALQLEYDFSLQWVRLFYLFGVGQHPNSLFASLQRAIDEGLPEFNMSAGEQLRDYLPVELAAHYLARIALQPDVAGIINCCNGKPISVRALVEQQLEARGSALRLNLGHFPYAAHEPMAFWGVNDRLQSLLGGTNAA